MDSLLQADIFFFISTLGFIVVFILVAILVLRLIKLLKIAREMAGKLEENVDTISLEAKEFFTDLRKSFLYRIFFGKKKK